MGEQMIIHTRIPYTKGYINQRIAVSAWFAINLVALCIISTEIDEINLHSPLFWALAVLWSASVIFCCLAYSHFNKKASEIHMAILETSFIFRDGLMFWVFRKPVNYKKSFYFPVDFAEDRTYFAGSQCSGHATINNDIHSIRFFEGPNDDDFVIALIVPDQAEWDMLLSAIKKHNAIQKESEFFPDNIPEDKDFA